MKVFSFFKLAAVVAATSIVIGCQKETSAVSADNLWGDESSAQGNKPLGHSLKCKFDLTYTLVPDVEAGNTQPQHPPGWYLAIGEGHMNLLGRAATFSNQYIKYVDSQDSLTVTNVPVTKFFKDTLSKLGINNIPDEVSLIFVDKHGNSLWSKGEEPYGHVLRTEQYFQINWVYDVIGGTGKFVNARGNFIYSGYQSLVDTTETAFEVVDGLIVY